MGAARTQCHGAAESLVVSGVGRPRDSQGLFSVRFLREARCSEANFNQAILMQTQLDEADFSHSQLSRAVLQQAHAPRANFQHSQLQYADLSYATLDHADFRDAHFTQTRLHRASQQQSHFSSRDGIIEQDEALYAAENWRPHTRLTPHEDHHESR